MLEIKPIASTLLYRRCDPATFDFETTAELGETDEVFGQIRAVEAVQFGIDINRPGYNLFVLGEAGSARHEVVRSLLAKQAAKQPPPQDWCYVNNFRDPTRPRKLPLPAGRGALLKHDMQEFVSELGKAISTAFESDEFHSRIEAIEEELKQREQHALGEISDDASKQGVALLRTSDGFTFAPLKGDEPLGPEEFAKLPEHERGRIGGLIAELGERLQRLLYAFPRWRRESHARIRQAGNDTMSLAVGHLIDELKGRYADLPDVLSFFDEIRRDIVESSEELRAQPKPEIEAAALVSGGISLQRYQINLLIGHESTTSAPLVFEDNPSYPNLVGRIDHISHLGTMVTNFTLLRAGAMHRANGGYLLLDALKVLNQPYAWEGLKRMLKSGQVHIESLSQALGWGSMFPLEPEPIPLSIKVVLFGEPFHYYLLKELDPEFAELFKVAADFGSDVERNEYNVRSYARLLAAQARRTGIRPLDRAAVARLVEDSARNAGDTEKLSTRIAVHHDLLLEADHYAGRDGLDTIHPAQIDQALAARKRRAARLPEAVQDAILRDTVLISTGGSHVGQVNGLAVVDLGEDFLFAHPVRITATARLGEGDVIDIEREAELGGAVHSKGVMILSSFLASRYSHNIPLSLSASLVFEQSYAPVEGDSASLAELCALLSALSGTPIRQSLAVTGSVNQHGEVQAIGAVNEKIEGFYDICLARGLTGDQGVLIPAANIKHLMLREDVVAAAAEGKFHVYAAAAVEEAIELLTGVPAGEPNSEGIVPEGSINYLVANRLVELAMMRQAYGAGPPRPRRRAKKDR